MKKIQEPKKVDLTEDDVKSLQDKIKNNQLSANEQELLVNVLQSFIWLNKMIAAKKLSIRRLLRLFGAKTEKSQKNKNKNKNKDDNNNGPGHSGKTSEKTGHGKNKSSEYTGAKKVFHPHETLSHGDRCPSCGKGNVYNYDPGIVLNIVGKAPIEATMNIIEKLRCGTCGEIFEAETPKEVRKQKYDETADVAIAMMRYAQGMPFNRLEDLQKYLGIPLPASTQWDRVEKLGDSAWPVYFELIKQAAKGKVGLIDDTTNRILDLKKALIDEDAKRKGIYTTAFISKLGEKTINLFFTGNKHAGENLDFILSHRPDNLPMLIKMSDALPANNSKHYDTEDCLCMTHGRRNFKDLEQDRPGEVRHVLAIMAKLYHNDNITKARNMTDEERLEYHQKHSGQWLKKLRRFFLKCFYLKKIEPNEPFGDAIIYMLEHWKGLTSFMRIAGAPLDNTETERLVKRSILHRKNSLFFKTSLGAFVGDIIMSLVETAKAANKNPYHYLVEIHKNKKLVKMNPELFLPWNYEANLPVYC
jgi:transposase